MVGGSSELYNATSASVYGGGVSASVCDLFGPVTSFDLRESKTSASEINSVGNNQRVPYELRVSQCLSDIPE